MAGNIIRVVIILIAFLTGGYYLFIAYNLFDMGLTIPLISLIVILVALAVVKFFRQYEY